MCERHAFLFKQKSYCNSRFQIAADLVMESAGEEQESLQALQSTPVESTKLTTVQGDGTIVVNIGSGSIVNITHTTCPQDVQEDHSTERQDCTKPPQNSQTFCLQLDTESRALVPVVPKLLGRPQRLNTKTQRTCRRFIDNLAQLSAKGKVAECRSTIAKLLKTKTDPDYIVALRHSASLNALNEGNFEEANRLLCEVEAFIPETRNEKEHRLWWYQHKSLTKLRTGNYDMGVVLVKEALPLLDTVAPGCVTAWLLINNAWFLSEIAAGQDDDNDREFLMKKAERDYQQAIEHAEYEDPKQMPHSQSRVPQLAKIGLAHLYLGCKEPVDSFKLELLNVSLNNIKKARNLIAALEKEELVCNVSKFLFMMAKTCLHYRLGSYKQAYDLAQEAKVFANEYSFGPYANLADGIVQYLQSYV